MKRIKGFDDFVNESLYPMTVVDNVFKENGYNVSGYWSHSDDDNLDWKEYTKKTRETQKYIDLIKFRVAIESNGTLVYWDMQRDKEPNYVKISVPELKKLLKQY